MRKTLTYLTQELKSGNDTPKKITTRKGPETNSTKEALMGVLLKIVKENDGGNNHDDQ